MKRVLLSIVGTIAGLVGLLGFKSHSTTELKPASLPSAALGGSSDSGTSAAPSTQPTTAPSTAQSSSSRAKTTTRTLTGTAEQTRYGVVQVEVTVKGTAITNVQFLQLTAFDPRSQQINQAAAPTLLQETLQAQSANISGVSGATYTSEGYIASLQSALDRL